MLVGRIPGVTVVLTPNGATAGVDVRGAPWGTRELDLLDPSTLVQRVHGIVLADGLASASGVVRWLSERHFGFPVGVGPHEVVPIVPAAAVGRGRADLGYQACAAAVPAEPGTFVLVGDTAAALVVVDADLDQASCRRVAMSAHDGLVRAGVRLPATVFALATGNPTGTNLNELCRSAADSVEESVGAVAR